MEIVKTGVAGTLESSDIMVTVHNGMGRGIHVHLESSVSKQFGKQIKKVIEESAARLGVQEAEINAVDKGALDCVIKARVETALNRACENTDCNWEVKE